MSDVAVQLVDPEDNSQNQYPRTLSQLVATANGSDVETELGKKVNETLQTTDVAPASGDKLVITDHSDSDKIRRSSLAFGTGQVNFLREDGQWAQPPTSGGTNPTDVQINGHSIVSSNTANLHTISDNYNATTNPLTTKNDLPTVPTNVSELNNDAGYTTFDGNYNSLSNKPTLGTAAACDVPSSGDAGIGEVVKWNDSRLSDSRTPKSHTHGNITNDGKLNDSAAAPANNDYLVTRDDGNNNIQTSNIKGTDVADAVSKKHSHTDIVLSTNTQQYDGSHTIRLPDSDPYNTARPPESHTHGNITNDGKLQTTDVTPAGGDKLVIVDNSNAGDGRVARSNIAFGSDTSKFLRNDGQWGTPPSSSGGISDVKIVRGSSQTSTVVNGISYLYTRGPYDPSNSKVLATVNAPSVTSGEYPQFDSDGCLVGSGKFFSSFLHPDSFMIKIQNGSGANPFDITYVNNSSDVTFVAGSGISITGNTSTRVITISNTGGGGGSYTAGGGIDITNNAISVVTAYSATIGTPEIGGLLVTADSLSDYGYCNVEDVVAVPIFHGEVASMGIQDENRSYDNNEPLIDYECHYVNVRAIVDAIIDEKTGLLDRIKEALGI